MKRRSIASLVMGALLLVIAQAHAPTDALPSRNEGSINETSGGISVVVSGDGEGFVIFGQCGLQ